MGSTIPHDSFDHFYRFIDYSYAFMLPNTNPIKATSVIHFEREVAQKVQQLALLLSLVEEVRDESDKAMVSATIREGKQFIKHVGSVRRAYTDPLQQSIKQWIAKEKELLAPVATAIERADGLIQQFNKQVGLRQQAAIKRIDKEEQQKQASEPANAELIAQEHEFKRQITVAQHSTEGVRNVWTFEIQNIANVPCEYLMLDEKKIRQAIRAGERHIPGLIIFQKQQTFYR